MSWETVIGLEIHAQLSTRSKIASTAFGAEPNEQASAVDLGLPGVLPVLNRDVVRMAVTLAVALGAEVAQRSVFARKNYSQGLSDLANVAAHSRFWQGQDHWQRWYREIHWRYSCASGRRCGQVGSRSFFRGNRD